MMTLTVMGKDQTGLSGLCAEQKVNLHCDSTIIQAEVIDELAKVAVRLRK